MNLDNVRDRDILLLSMACVNKDTFVVATWIDRDSWTRTLSGSVSYVAAKVDKLDDAPPGSSAHPTSGNQIAVALGSNRPKGVRLEVEDVLITDNMCWEKLETFHKYVDHDDEHRIVLLKAGGHSYVARWVDDEDASAG